MNDHVERTSVCKDLFDNGSLIRGTGEMADRIRAYAWSETSLGSVEGWPCELLAFVNLMLVSREIGTVFWGPDRIMIYNDAYVAQLGARHPMLGRPLREVWPEVAPQVEPLIDRVFQEGTSSYLDDTPLMVFEDGQETERFYTASYEPIWVRQNDRIEVQGIYQTAINNTAKLRLQQQLQASEGETKRAKLDVERTANQLRLAIEAADLATWYFDPDQQIVGGDAKMGELFGISGAVGPAELWISRIHPEDRQRVSEEFAAALAGKPYDTSYRVQLGDQVRWLKAKARQVEDDGKRRLVGLCEDVTRIKMTEAAVMRNEKLAAVGRLASSISHEINNPLESVTNLLYLIKSNSDLDAIREYTETAERELRRVSLITNQTLRFHRQSTYASPFFCHDLIGDSLSLFQGRLVNSNIQVEKRKRAEEPITCLGGEVRQVISNLIGNAIDAMPRGGRLILRSRAATHWKTGEKGLAITVADTGIGMNAETQKKIFEAFFTTKGIGGTGLGLWISCEIVNRHGGTLRVRSSQAKQHTGTVFSLFLPYALPASFEKKSS